MALLSLLCCGTVFAVGPTSISVCTQVLDNGDGDNTEGGSFTYSIANQAAVYPNGSNFPNTRIESAQATPPSCTVFDATTTPIPAGSTSVSVVQGSTLPANWLRNAPGYPQWVMTDGSKIVSGSGLQALISASDYAAFSGKATITFTNASGRLITQACKTFLDNNDGKNPGATDFPVSIAGIVTPIKGVTEGGPTVCANINYNIPITTPPTTQVVLAEDPVYGAATGFPKATFTGSKGGTSSVVLLSAPGTFQLNAVTITGSGATALKGDVKVTIQNQISTAVPRTYSFCAELPDVADVASGSYTFASDQKTATQTALTLKPGSTPTGTQCSGDFSELPTVPSTPVRLFSMPATFVGFAPGFPQWNIYDKNDLTTPKLSGFGAVGDIPWNDAKLAGLTNVRVIFSIESAPTLNVTPVTNTGSVLRLCELVDDNMTAPTNTGSFVTRLFRSGSGVHYTGGAAVSEGNVVCHGTVARWADNESFTVTQTRGGGATWHGDVAGYPQLRTYNLPTEPTTASGSATSVQMPYNAALTNDYVNSNYIGALTFTTASDVSVITADKTSETNRMLTFCLKVQNNGIDNNGALGLDGGMFSMDLGAVTAKEGSSTTCFPPVVLPDPNGATWPNPFSETLFTPTATATNPIWPGYDTYTAVSKDPDAGGFATAPYVKYSTTTGQNGQNQNIFALRAGFMVLSEPQSFFAGLNGDVTLTVIVRPSAKFMVCSRVLPNGVLPDDSNTFALSYTEGTQDGTNTGLPFTGQAGSGPVAEGTIPLCYQVPRLPASPTFSFSETPSGTWNDSNNTQGFPQWTTTSAGPTQPANLTGSSYTTGNLALPAFSAFEQGDVTTTFFNRQGGQRFVNVCNQWVDNGDGINNGGTFIYNATTSTSPTGTPTAPVGTSPYSLSSNELATTPTCSPLTQLDPFADTIELAQQTGAFVEGTGYPQWLITDAAFKALTPPVSGTGDDTGLIDVSTIKASTFSIIVQNQSANDADLEVTNTAPASTTAGSTIPYTIKITNNGPSAATGVTLDDTIVLPATFVSASGPCSAGFPCALGNLGVGATTTITVMVNIPANYLTAGGASPIANTAKANSTSPTDKIPANNTAVGITTIGASADLQVTNTGPTTASKGTNVTYSLAIKNAGAADAQAVSLTNPTPAGLTLVGVAAGTGVLTGCTALPCNLPTMAALATGSVQVTYAIPLAYAGASPFTDAANISSTTPDPIPVTNNSASVQTAVGTTVDLSVLNDDGSTTYTPGQQVTYTVVFSNAGPSNAVAATILDTLSSQAISSAWTCVGAGGGVCPAASGTSNISATANLPAGSKITFTIIAQIDPNATGSLTSSASITAPAGETDSNTSNNSRIDSDTLAAAADLSITKTGPATVLAASPISYTIVVSNGGPSVTSGAQISDTVPAGITNVSWTCIAGGTSSCGASTSGGGNTIALTTGNFGTASADKITLTVTGTAPSSATTVTNQAQVVAPAGVDTKTANNTSAVITTKVNPTADIGLSMTLDNATPNVGDVVTFVVTATNNGPSDATGVQVTDGLPFGLALVTATPATGTAYTAGTGLWDIGALANGSSTTLTLKATVTATGQITNTATRTAETEPDGTPGNDSAAQILNAKPSADVQMSMTVDNSSPNVGTSVVFTVTATNAGPDAASGVQVKDILPAGLTFVSSSTGAGAYDSSTGIWTIGPIANGANAKLTINATVTQAGSITNAATKTAEIEHDAMPGNDQASVTLNGQSADIGVTMTVDNASPSVGTPVTFTVTVNNIGPSNATGVVVKDKLPTGLTFSSATPSVGTYDDLTGIWSIGSMASSGATATATLTLTGQVTTAGAITNTASKTAVDQTDGVTTNDSKSLTLNGLTKANLSITNGDGVTQYTPGGSVTYTVVVSNSAGPSPITGATVVDTLPSQVTSATWTCTSTPGATCPAASGTSNINGLVDLPLDSSVTFVIVTNISASAGGNLINAASITVPGGATETDPSDNSATDIDTTGALTSDLAITKSGAASVAAGDQIIYSIVVTNGGPSATFGAQIIDAVDAGITNVTWTCTGAGASTCGPLASGSGNAIAITTGKLGTDLADSLTITVTGTAPGNVPSITNSAKVKEATGTTDSIQANNTSSAVVTAIAPVADIGVGISVDNATPKVGDTIHLTLAATNHGPSDATGIQLTDLLPAGLDYVSSAPSQGTYASGTGVWDVGALTDGSAASIVITATASVAGGVTDTVARTAGDQPDNTAANDSASIPLAIGNAIASDVSVVVSGPSSATAGTQVTYSITVSNLGPSDATGVTIANTTPAGLTFVSATGSCPSFPCSIGNLAAGASTIVSVTYAVPAGTPAGTVTATAAVSSTTADPNAANNSSSVATAIGNSANVAVRMTGPTNVNSEGQIVYTLIISNAGPSNADGTSFSDTLPVELTNVTSNCSNAIGGASCGSVTVSSLKPASAAKALSAATAASVAGVVPLLPAGGSVTITISGTAPVGPATITNSASVTTSAGTVDPVLANNSAALTTTVQAPGQAGGGTATPVPVNSLWLLACIVLGSLLLGARAASRR